VDADDLVPYMTPPDPDARRRAEERSLRAAGDAQPVAPEQAGRLVHELRVHQIELEMQNEELRRAEEELDASRATYLELFDLAPVGYIALDDEGLVRRANLTAARLLGVERADLEGAPFTRFVAAADQDVFYLHHRRLRAAREPQACELRLRRRGAADGEREPPFWAQLEGRPQPQPDEPQALWLTFTDVTARHLAEQAVRESEARFRGYFEQSLVGVAVTSPQKGWLEANQAVCDLLGYERAELAGLTWAELTHPDDLAADLAQFARALAGEIDGYRLEKRFLRKDGDVVEVDLSVHCQRAPDGKVEYFLALLSDVTERRRAERALRETEDRQMFVLELTDWLRGMSDERDVLLASAGALTAKLGVDRVGWALPEDETADDGDEAVRSARRADHELFTSGEDHGEPLSLASGESAPNAIVSGAFVPVKREGIVAACLYAVAGSPHAWPQLEQRLLRDVAERTWSVVERVRAEQAVRHETARLQAVIDAVPIGFAFYDPHGALDRFNDEASRIWGGSGPAEPALPDGERRGFWPGTGRPLEREEWPAMQALLHGTVSKDVVVDIERYDGSRGTIVLSAAPIAADGVTVGAAVGMQDITELRRAEQVLRLLSDEVRILHEASVLDSSLPLNELTRTVAVRARALLESDGCAVYRIDERGALRREILVGAPSPKDGPGVRPLVRAVVARAAARGAAGAEQDAPATDGADPGPDEGTCLAVPLALRANVFGAIALHFREPRRFDGHYRRVARAFADQAALAIENAHLRTRVAESAAEGERTRLARDLHDSVTQALFAASLKAEALARVSDDVSPRAVEIIEQVRRLTRGALAQMRTMLLEMRGEPLSDVPLAELLRHLVEAAESRASVSVSLTIGGRCDLSPQLHDALYRITQEALNNVVRHARAARAWISLDLSADSLRLVIGDDGAGFDPRVPRASHLGLRTMQERARSAGAELSLITRMGGGTVVTVEWPDRGVQRD
jgi:PAS domain S-box-containing protein